MTGHPFATALMILLAGASGLLAQSPSQFGSCAYWQDQKPGPSDASALIDKSYRVGFAHGFVFGVLGDLPSDRPSDPKLAALESRYSEGLIQALQRPAFLVEAFDQKCSDYRNRRVYLSDVGMLVLLEVGGISSQAVERALEIMRAGGDANKERVVEALLLPR